MIVHLNGSSKVAPQHEPTHMLLSDTTSEDSQGPLREHANSDRPLSVSSPFPAAPVEASQSMSPSSVDPTSHQKQNQGDEPARPDDDESEQQPKQPPPVLLLKVSAEENTEFKEFVDDEDDNDDDDSRNEQTSIQTCSSRSLNASPARSERQSEMLDFASGPGNDCQMADRPNQAEVQSCALTSAEVSHNKSPPTAGDHSGTSNEPRGDEPIIELRFLVRRREAGALIGKRGSNIKRLRETFRSSMFSIPDTGNGPERVVCIATNEKSLDPILTDLTQLLMEKSPENDEQIELKLLIHSSHAGSIIGIGGQSIKKLRNESKAAIKIYEMCCPLSNERVCAIKAKPHVAVNTIKLIQSILNENPIKGTIKPYDALHFNLGLIDKYGGYLPDEPIDMLSNHYLYEPMAAAYGRSFHENGGDNYLSKSHCSIWRSPDHHESSCEIHDASGGSAKAEGPTGCYHRVASSNQSTGMNTAARLPGKLACTPYGKLPADSATKGLVLTQCESTGDCANQPASTKTSPHPSVYTPPPSMNRFHPYAPPLSSQSNFMACNRLQMQRQQSPIDGPAICNSFPRLMYPYGSQMHLQRAIARCARGPGEDFPNVPERCRHGARACPCMLMPMTIPDLLSGGPFVQMNAYNGGARGSIGGATGAKTFHYYSRSPSHGVNKKK